MKTKTNKVKNKIKKENDVQNKSIGYIMDVQRSKEQSTFIEKSSNGGTKSIRYTKFLLYMKFKK